MKWIEYIKEGELHHAYLIEGERSVATPLLVAHLESIGIVTRGNPDFHLREVDAFLIEHAQEIRGIERLRGVLGSKFIVVAFNTMLSEAQNSLLKTLEEPTEGTHFFFITRTEENLLPTVRSRMHVIKEVKSDHKDHRTGDDFLHAELPLRMKMIEPMVKAKADEKGEAKEEARQFLDKLEQALYRRMKDGNIALAGSLEHILSAKQYLSDRAPSLKLLLEHLALTIPKIS